MSDSPKSSILGFSVVHHSIINFSTAQHKFSFGKGKRFNM